MRLPLLSSQINHVGSSLPLFWQSEFRVHLINDSLSLYIFVLSGRCIFFHYECAYSLHVSSFSSTLFIGTLRMFMLDYKKGRSTGATVSKLLEILELNYESWLALYFLSAPLFKHDAIWDPLSFSFSYMYCFLVLCQGLILIRTITTKTLCSFIGLLGGFSGIELRHTFAVSWNHEFRISMGSLQPSSMR